MLGAQNLTKSFGGLLAVSSLSFQLKPGEILGLIGPNGAGKTTVFNLLTGFMPPDAGTVHLEGDPILGLKPHDICRRGLVRTFQIVRPFLNISVLDNVLVGALARIGSVSQARARARSIIDFVGLGEVTHLEAQSLPLPLRKRLELARALATKPKVLLLDEVMAGLNPTEVDELIDLILQVNRSGVSILLIEHVMRGVMALSQRVIVINYGEMIAEGSPDEIVKNPTVIEAYLGKEFVVAERA
ncbi:MAG: ABC transporter ATP-binding protein [Deltaproteobacteria bacterium]|nr:ABC transporter ATP-binding protein [Deltaproteobacteria bacterium]